MYRIGVDVGGTNTDAAILDVTASSSVGRGVLASCKTSTSADITSGIYTAIETVIAKSGVNKASILSITIGTTHFVNALVEADARRLSRVGVVRLCGPFTQQIPPFSDFPVGLRRILDGGAWFLDGGLEVDGREIAPLCPDQIAACVAEIQKHGIKSVAVVGVFSPLDSQGMHEDEVKRQMLAIDPSLRIVCSHSIGPPGLLARENATILNASLLSLAQKTIGSFEKAMRRLRLASCPLHLSQNDGTILDIHQAADYPIKTFASGPTNSLTGAAFLAGLDRRRHAVEEESGSGAAVPGQDAQILVVDIGGTTTDVCALLPSGFPRQAPNYVEITGVRTAFSIPEVLSIGLGGGSKVDTDPVSGRVTLGPDSVGHYLTKDALVFGGSVLTVTDIVVAAGGAQLGDPAWVSGVDSAVVSAASDKMRHMLQSVIQRMKVSDAPVHVLLVGGGALLVPQDMQLDGVASWQRPMNHDAANAVGAAIAKAAGDVDVIEILEGRDEQAVVQEACAKATRDAVARGADPADVKIVSITKIPLQYTAKKAMRLVVKAVGQLAGPVTGGRGLVTPPSEAVSEEQGDDEAEEEEGGDEVEEEGPKVRVPDAATPVAKPSLKVNLHAYRPQVGDRTWYISDVDLELIATGTGILGTGGGGSSYLELVRSLTILREAGPGKMRVVSPQTLQDSDVVCFGSWYGAPDAGNERFGSGGEIIRGIEVLKKILNIESCDAVLTDEIGGGNGLTAFATGVQYDIPVLDGDAMGRAFPTMYHSTLYLEDNPIMPCAMTDPRGNTSILMEAESPKRVESILRAFCSELGSSCAVCARPLGGDVVRNYAVPNTISQAWYLGRAVHLARRNKTCVTNAIFETTPGKVLFTGKIVAVQRNVGDGYTLGSVLIAPHGADQPVNTIEQSHLRIPFQNEYLYAAYTDAQGLRETAPLCTVPDLISILGEDGEAIGSQELRYGLDVIVIAMPAHPLWKTKRGMDVGGPKSFGLDMAFVGVGEYAPPKSVIEEFGARVTMEIGN